MREFSETGVTVMYAMSGFIIVFFLASLVALPWIKRRNKKRFMKMFMDEASKEDLTKFIKDPKDSSDEIL